ncbi:50S ribosomal protein L25 [candidate division WWE3 bacterium CG08_land_8_20_14_0_20_40_13]|uniref:Large ribosomal subunit protein bL25 n=1 Tax=candidate division WWE3 bacterium CG08_land_8_20_14_0_20_40_13 TaxID=1975084 RepID=A0A2H0XEX8_UNCKA|nr:MAG: 50S ribosomal protein L25 [candidate division WWE3 bacterium CG08_land_8_20_14_0_20_40_13]
MEIIAKKRTIEGKKVKTLRRVGTIPTSVFGKEISPMSLEVDEKLFTALYNTAGETALINLKIESENPIKVLISDVQIHPVTGRVIHATFHKVKLTEKITAKVPVEITGESSIVKSGEGIVLHLMSEIEMECLPYDLPQNITVDISHLEKIDDAIAVKDLPIDRDKVAVKADPEELVVKIDYAKQQEKEEEVPVSEQELISKVEAAKELTEEEKAKREAEKKEGEKKEEGE